MDLKNLYKNFDFYINLIFNEDMKKEKTTRAENKTYTMEFLETHIFKGKRYERADRIFNVSADEKKKLEARENSDKFYKFY